MPVSLHPAPRPSDTVPDHRPVPEPSGPPDAPAMEQSSAREPRLVHRAEQDGALVRSSPVVSRLRRWCEALEQLTESADRARRETEAHRQRWLLESGVIHLR